jgi:hypothetical protein
LFYSSLLHHHPAQQAEREAANNLSSASGKRVAHRRQVSAGKSIATLLHIQDFVSASLFIGEISPKKKRKIENESDFGGFNRQK